MLARSGVLLLLLALAGSLDAAAGATTAWSFEGGSLNGWTRTGEAFAHQPVKGDPYADRQFSTEPAGIEGSWSINTYEKGASFSDFQGDAPKGIVHLNLTTIVTSVEGIDPSIAKAHQKVFSRDGSGPGHGRWVASRPTY